jgi:hypothetical protein
MSEWTGIVSNTTTLVLDIKAVTKSTDIKGLKCVSDVNPVSGQTQYLAIGPVSDKVPGTWRGRRGDDSGHEPFVIPRMSWVSSFNFFA